VEIYKNDPELTYRAIVKIYNVSYQSIINYYYGEKKFSPDYYKVRQKLLLIEESVLVIYNMRAY